MIVFGRSDVGAVTGVPVSNVPNVLHRPRKIKKETRESADAGKPDVGIFNGIEVLGSSLLVQLLVGSYVGLISRGRMTARGWIDMVSADGTTAWVWLDGGRGRLMVHSGDGIGLMVLEESADVAYPHETTNKNRKSKTTAEGN
jgi:hypothetical protein